MTGPTGPYIQPGEAEVLTAAWTATDTACAHARALLRGEELPGLHTAEYVDAPTAVRLAVLALGGLHEAFLTGPDRRTAHRRVSLDVSADPFWRGYAAGWTAGEQVRRYRAALNAHHGQDIA
ncbi:MAG: hypothetical protein ACR2GH_07155 [Pseudonocardia sp.]